MKLLFANNAISALASGITSVATTLAVQAGHGARFPQPAVGEGFYLTLFQVIGGIESNYEVVLVTGRSIDTLTIVRGQEGTTARAFNAGDSVSHRPTAQTMRAFAQPDEAVTFAKDVTFTMGPTAPTAAAGTNTTQVATTQFTKTEISNAISALVNGAATALDTLSELAAALGNDANFATTTSNALGNRLRVDTAAQGLTAQQQTNAKTNLALVKADVGLGSVDNTSDVNKPVSTAQQTALNLKADLASPTFTGDPKAPTPASGDNDTSLATTAFVQQTVNGMLTKSVAGGATVALTAAEAGYPVIKLTGALTANISVTVPAAANRFIVWNATSGAFTLTFKTPAGTGVLVAQGKTSNLFCDGVNVLDANNDTTDMALTGNPTAPTPTAGDNDTSVATTAFVQSAMAAFGLGAVTPPALTDLDVMTTKSGIYLCDATTVTGTKPATFGVVLVTSYAGGGASNNWANQTFFATDGKTYMRNSVNLAAWSAWRTVAAHESPAFSGTPTAPTAAQTTNSTQIATTAYVRTAVSDLVASSPAALDTLNELATALGNDANFAATTSTALGNRLRVDTAAQGLTTTQQANAKTNLALVKGDVGLGSVDNTSDVNKPVSTAQQNALNLKSNLASPTFTGTPAAPTAAAGTNTTQLATTAFVTAAAATKAALAGSTAQDFAAKDLVALSFNGGPLAGLRNVLINGKFDHWQRGTNFSVVPGALTYTADRWMGVFAGSSNGTVQIAAFGSAAGAAPLDKNVLLMTVPASAAGSNLRQRIEGVNTLNGSAVALSFYAKNVSGTTTLTASLIQNFGTGGTPSADVPLSLTGSAVLGTDYTKYTLTGTLANITGKTLGTNGNDFLELSISTSSNLAHSFGITGIQLEQGSVGTPFELRPVALELALCQRYYQRLDTTEDYRPGSNGVDWYVPYRLPVVMRAVPSVGLPSFTNAIWNSGGADVSPSAAYLKTAYASGFSMHFSAPAGQAMGGMKPLTYTLNAEL